MVLMLALLVQAVPAPTVIVHVTKSFVEWQCGKVAFGSGSCLNVLKLQATIEGHSVELIDYHSRLSKPFQAVLLRPGDYSARRLVEECDGEHIAARYQLLLKSGKVEEFQLVSFE